jgi:hypothetical protein
MENEKTKLAIILMIDKLRDEMFNGTSYDNELNMLRKKYIYKDIASYEIIKDTEYLFNLKNINYYYEKR